MNFYQMLEFVGFILLFSVIGVVFEYFMLKRDHRKLDSGEWQIEGNG